MAKQKGRREKKRRKRVLNAVIDGITENRAARAVGRPVEYRSEYAEFVLGLALLGLKNDEIADQLKISHAEFTLWLERYPELSASIAAGREGADANVAKAMYHRAQGYEHKDTYIAQYQGRIITKEIIKRYPPDTAAASLWLRNRHPERWRDRIEYTPTPPGEAARVLREQMAEMDASTSEEKKS